MGGDLRRDTMAQYRYSVTCRECGKITADTTDDGLFDKATAHRRAGHHEGAHGGGHECDVEIEEETKEYRCPVCQTKCIGERERDEHAKSEPGVQPSSFVRV
jgi:hypothetical protein